MKKIIAIISISRLNRMMLKALLPGTFDPPTYGHFNLIKRASRLFDHLVVGIGENRVKREPLLTKEEKIEVLKKELAGLKNVEITSFSGLAWEYAKEKGASLMVRGLRSESDIAYETQMARVNFTLGGIETFFLMGFETAYISSTLVRELAFHRASLKDFIPRELETIIYARMQKGEVK